MRSFCRLNFQHLSPAWTLNTQEILTFTGRKGIYAKQIRQCNFFFIFFLWGRMILQFWKQGLHIGSLTHCSISNSLQWKKQHTCWWEKTGPGIMWSVFSGTLLQLCVGQVAHTRPHSRYSSPGGWMSAALQPHVRLSCTEEMTTMLCSSM